MMISATGLLRRVSALFRASSHALLVAVAAVVAAAATSPTVAAPGEIEPEGDALALAASPDCYHLADVVVALDDERFARFVTAEHDLAVARFGLDGEPVGEPIGVAPLTTFDAFTLAADGGGGFVVAWATRGDPHGYARRFDAAGGALGEAVEIAEYAGGNPFRIGIFPATDGAVAFVHHFVPAPHATRSEARWFDADLTPLGEPFAVAETTTEGAATAMPVEASGGTIVAGGVLAVAGQFRISAAGQPDRFEIRTRRFGRDGLPLGAVKTVAALPQSVFPGPRLVPNPDGGYGVVWLRRAFSLPDRIDARRYDDAGRPDGDPYPLAEAAGGAPEIHGFSVAADPSGNWLLSWTNGDEVTVLAVSLVGVERRPARPLGLAPEPVTYPFWTAIFPRPGGRSTVFWQNVFRPIIGAPICPSLPIRAQALRAGCLEGDLALCLAADRFSVGVAWHDQHNGGSGRGRTLELTADTGAFWFFRDGNLELVTKLLDARTVNGRFWFFSGAMTEVGYDLTVIDTETGDRRNYRNEPGTFRSLADIAAFDDEPGGEEAGGAPGALLPFGPLPAAAAAGLSTPAVEPCPADPQVICLNHGRFAVEVDWLDPHNGGSGRGQALPLTDDTGAFWFFNPANLELAVKVLDGLIVNGHFWVFYASLTDVEFRLTITDRETGTSRFFDNPPFHLASAGETEAF